MLSHANLVANVLQTEAWVRGAFAPGREVALVPLPLYLLFALTCPLTFMRLGATNVFATNVFVTNVLVTNRRDLPALIKEITHAKPSAINGVNTLFRALLDTPGVAGAATGTLKLAVAGGMTMQRGVAERWQQRFGVHVTEGYGLTETSPIVCANRLDAGQFTSAIGLPIPSTEVAILTLGKPGEICVRGPQVMHGYGNNPDETAKVVYARRLATHRRHRGHG